MVAAATTRAVLLRGPPCFALLCFVKLSLHAEVLSRTWQVTTVGGSGGSEDDMEALRCFNFEFKSVCALMADPLSRIAQSKHV